MKLLDLKEANTIVVQHPKMAQINAAFKEIGEKWKWPRGVQITDELLMQAIGMMKDAGKNDAMASTTALLTPLETLNRALGQTQDMALKDIMNALAKLMPIGHFMHEDMNKQLQRACAQVANAKEELQQYSMALRMTIGALINLQHVVDTSKDEYHRSIARAVLKNLGLNKE